MFEEFIAQGKDMIRRQEKQIGHSAYFETQLPAHEKVTIIEANAWKKNVEERIQTYGGPDAYARYQIFWAVYKDELEKGQGDESSRWVNFWQRVVAHITELDQRLAAAESATADSVTGQVRIKTSA